jgi:esterase/lipase superfamily enzyme
VRELEQLERNALARPLGSDEEGEIPELQRDVANGSEVVDLEEITAAASAWHGSFAEVGEVSMIAANGPE